MSALSLFSRFTHKPKLVLLFDIGNASVGVALVKYEKNRPVRILLTYRELIQFKEQQGGEHLGEYLRTTIEKVGTHALEAIAKIPDARHHFSVQAIIHSPWSDSQSQRVESILPEEISVNKELLQDFMVQHLPNTKQKGRVQYDRHVMRIELNGYPTLNPYHKKAKTIAVTAIQSTMAEPIYTAMRTGFANILPNHEVHFDAFLYAAIQLRESFDDHGAYTIVDIGGEYTSVSIIRNDTVAGTAWANFGTEHLIRAVSKNQEDSRSTVISEISMFLNNSCTPAQCRKIEEALKIAEKEWTENFAKTCESLSKTHRIPSRVFISVPRRFGPWFESVVEKIDFGQFTVTGRPMDATLFSTEHPHRGMSFAEHATRDDMLSLGAIFVDK